MKAKETPKWWGAPRKFSIEHEERKISWLELFYDLVYVIAISNITHHLAMHLNLSGLLDFVYFFIMIFWGWFNGSLHHDLHASVGLRTRLMTLWQIMIVAALIITMNSESEQYVFNATIALMVMQFFITYLWWSVGIYDKVHRRLNIPYTVCFLLSMAIMLLTLFLKQPYIRIAFYISLLLNYLPFIAPLFFRKSTLEFNLSSSMTERLGLFTIIIFGEVVLGIINGISALHHLNFSIWSYFILSMLIVFLLWWIFFSLIADKDSNKRRSSSYLIPLTYIPTLMSMGLLAVSFNKIFSSFTHGDDANLPIIKSAFCVFIAIFLIGVIILINFLTYPQGYHHAIVKMQRILFFVVAALFILATLNSPLDLMTYLFMVFLMLLGVVVFIFRSWVKVEVHHKT